MTLKSIELNSFKSFGKKSAVTFTTPITCIVGPNGSGKSNIVESIRFVLGEQSIKSLRGKGGADMIFKGSKGVSSANRASVTITFDNSKKIFSFTNSGLGVSLDYDEVTISREVYADGVNRYSINGAEVRLKDVVDLLASVNIGSSGHHIISQGEADRVLNASSKDRRAMIEDALGLKVYQYRIREGERKLEKTFVNMKEVQALRREITPHLAFLKKQVQVLERSKLMREELRELYKAYFPYEGTYIQSETKSLTHNRRMLDEKIASLNDRIDRIQQSKNDTVKESPFAKDIRELDTHLNIIRAKKDEVSRSLGRIEGMILGIERQFANLPEKKEKVISEAELKDFISGIERHIDEAIESGDLPHIINILKNMKSKFVSFFERGEKEEDRPKLEENGDYIELQNEKEKIIQSIEHAKRDEERISGQINELKHKENEMQKAMRDGERVLYELMSERSVANSDLNSLIFQEEKLKNIKNAFEMELSEASVLIGREALDFARTEVEGVKDRGEQEDLRRKIERIKIKLEDVGTGSGHEVIKEYEETVERDNFLARELEDLNKSIESIRVLIQDMKETLDKEFKTGVDKINKQFQEFFSLMFGGGSAFLSIVMEHKKSKKKGEEDEESEEEVEGEADLGFERGIEINVTLPQKKVKDLHMLSGGERSLTSIALLFAISQVNPPPFLVLDETDAALDEANSRRYGSMLENLSKYSELIVVTHNRETMSRAQVLYGVTMGAEGASKLLSIRLEDASAYAK